MELLIKSRVLVFTFIITQLCLAAFGALINGRFPYYILEELPAHTMIGKVAADARLNEKYSKEIYDELVYSIRYSDYVELGLFSINPNNSIISTAVEIDRDSICNNQPTCHIPLDIVVGPGEYYEIIQIVIDILDINDHEPTFESNSVFLRIPESSSVGTKLQVPLAVDIDSRQFSVQSYEIVPKNGMFALHTTRNSEGEIINLQLEIAMQLDHERFSIYQVKLVARDGGVPPLSGYIMLNIEISDVNDNIPEFDSRTYEVFVSENVEINSVIAKVSAADADEGEFGVISYRFSDSTMQMFPHTFSIDETTGEIFIRNTIDFETRPLYTLEVLASNKGSPDTVSQASVIIRVIDTNDWVPQISVTTFTSDGIARVKENSIQGTDVAYISVVDQDGGQNGEVGCLVDNDLFAIAKTDRQQFKLVTSGDIDKEKVDAVQLTISCFDYGIPPNKNYATLNVTVQDENDHTPEFTTSVYEIGVTENNPVGISLLTVSASDTDQGDNSVIFYTIEKQYRSIFDINQNTGLITAKISFDREKTWKLNFHVTATDKGTPPESSNCTVELTILDENDCPPKFGEHLYAFGVSENDIPNTKVGFVVATDADLPPHNVFHYKIIKPNSSHHIPFKIDQESGRISTTRLLDREATSAYYFKVTASNQYFPPMTSTASVTVYVADRNDNSPVLVWPNYEDHFLSIASNTPIGVLVTNVLAYDDDIGDNGKLHYMLQHGRSTDYFDLDLNRGVLSLRKHIDNLGDSTVSLTIAVSDNGENMRTVYANLDIYINTSMTYNASGVNMNTTTSPHNYVNESNSILYINNNRIIILALSSVGLLLVFVIVLTLVFVRKFPMFTTHHSPCPHGANSIRASKGSFDKLGEEEC